MTEKDRSDLAFGLALGMVLPKQLHERDDVRPALAEGRAMSLPRALQFGLQD